MILVVWARIHKKTQRYQLKQALVMHPLHNLVDRELHRVFTGELYA